MHRIEEAPTVRDYLITSRQSYSLRQFVDLAFRTAGLQAVNHIVTDSALLRPSDLTYSGLNPARIESELGWKAATDLEAIVAKMDNNDLF